MRVILTETRHSITLRKQFRYRVVYYESHITSQRTVCTYRLHN